MKDWTDVRSRRFGEGAIDGLGKELGDFIVTSMPVPWEATRPRLGAAPKAVCLVDT